MANREELAIIRDARAGRAEAQLALGKLYLFGSTGLPQSLATALHWLDRAAKQGCTEAWMLIGVHIPFDVAQPHAHAVTPWFERAYDAGLARAGVVLAQLVAAGAGALEHLRAKAHGALEAAARAGMADAQWLMSQQHAGVSAIRPFEVQAVPAQSGDKWLARAADNGIVEAQYELIARAWEEQQWAVFLRRALPLAQQLVQGAGSPGAAPLAPASARLLSRCAQLLAADGANSIIDPATVRRFWELGADGGDRDAQLAVGLWCARMQIDGTRTAQSSGSANFKKAIRWLTMAGEQGLAQAWYALSRIYIKPEFSQRNISEAQIYLERAATMGYCEAQLECGTNAWRARRDDEENDVRAAYWLQKAAAQGSCAAREALRKIAPEPDAPAWVDPGCAGQLADSHPFLAARIELAALFHLTRPEALLLDLKAADRGHCLVIDIRAIYGRSKRRLVPVQGAQARRALDRIARLFEDVDCSLTGPEGNYRQRLYRLKTLLPQAMPAGATEGVAEDYELAA